MMRKGAGSRRVARRIGSPSSEESDGTSGPAVKRPPPKNKQKGKSKPSLPTTHLDSDNDDNSTSTFKSRPNKAALSHAAAARLLARDADSPSDTRPSYTRDSLTELRDSTPKAPPPPPPSTEDGSAGKQLDLQSKFGASWEQDYNNSTGGGILSEAQIRERKDRRQRLALEERVGLHSGGKGEGEDFINLETNEHGLARWEPSIEERYKGPKRLEVDEDMLLEEDADDRGGIGDEKLAISRKERKRLAEEKRREISAMIAEAEESTSSDNDGDGEGAEEGERNRAFEAAQTAKGTGHERVEAGQEGWTRPRTPKIQPILGLRDIEERLKESLVEMQRAVGGKREAIAELRAERDGLESRRVEVQKELDRTGEVVARLTQILEEKKSGVV